MDWLPIWIYNNPSWLVTSVFLVVAIGVAFVAMIVVYLAVPTSLREQHGELASFTVTNIAVLYAVLLAFIAVATWESYTKSTELAQSEADLAGNLYRDTRGLPSPTDGELRSQIEMYLQTVIAKEWPLQQAGIVPADGWPVLDRIHQDVASINPINAGQTVLMQEMLHGLNELYSARTSRLSAVSGHIPIMVWFVLVAVGGLTIGYSCLVRASGLAFHMLMVGGLTAALTLVMALIVELDYPFRGNISVTSEPYQQVLDSFPTEKSANGG